MDKTQADAIAQAILDREPLAKEESRLKRARQAEKVASQRRQAKFVLAGYALGAASGYFISGSVGSFGLLGALVGILLSIVLKRFHESAGV